MIHANDNHAADDLHLAPFLGCIQWEAVIAGLHAAGYQGSMNLEVNTRRVPDRMKKEYGRCIALSCEQLIQMFLKGA